MTISFLPKFLLEKISKDPLRQIHWNVLLSNSAVVLVFLFFGNRVLDVLGRLPHFCLFKKLFSVDCPFCGVTRGFAAIFDGQFQTALQFNPISFLVLILMAHQMLARAYFLSKSIAV